MNNPILAQAAAAASALAARAARPPTATEDTLGSPTLLHVESIDVGDDDVSREPSTDAAGSAVVHSVDVGGGEALMIEDLD